MKGWMAAAKTNWVLSEKLARVPEVRRARAKFASIVRRLDAEAKKKKGTPGDRLARHMVAAVRLFDVEFRAEERIRGNEIRRRRRLK